MPDAVIAFDFDPLLQVGNGFVRLETIGVAVAIFAALVIAGGIARRMGLRGDDLLFVVLGVVPGAVIGGRLGYVLLHPAFFGADPGRILDPSAGSLELTLGVVGGALTGAMVAALLDNRPGRWLHLATIPMLVIVALGKLSMILGGSGQGQATSGDVATLYLGPGPWGSLGPKIPSIPSQALEGVASVALLDRDGPRPRVRVRAAGRRAGLPPGACRLGGRAARGGHDVAGPGDRRPVPGGAADRPRGDRRLAGAAPARREPVAEGRGNRGVRAG